MLGQAMLLAGSAFGEPVKWLGKEWPWADGPRHAVIEPRSNFLYVCNDRGDAITIFRIRGGGQLLEHAGYEAVRIPSFIGFLRIA